MHEMRYGKSFLIACLINATFLIFLGLTGQVILDKSVSKKTQEMNIVALDMSHYQVQGNNPNKPIGPPGGTPSAGTGNGKGNQGTNSNVTQNSTPYAGGVEDGDVGVSNVMGQGGLHDGAAQRAYGEGGGGDGDGSGGTGGGYGTGEGGGGNGYVDLSGYLAKLNQIKEYPAQALNRGIVGTAVYSVTFSADGDVESISLISSSGSSILDNAARRLIERGGRILNTTGRPTTETVPIVYELN